MKRFGLAALAAAVAIGTALWPTTASARHGIVVRLSIEGRSVMVRASYDGGGPATGAGVTVHPPQGDTPFQSGLTDGQGRFTFVPDRPGDWRVEVDDGLGHRRLVRFTFAGVSEQAGMDTADVTTDVEEEEHRDHGVPAGPGVHPPTDPTRPWKVATGLSLIFGLTGVAYALTARRNLPR